ncbi:MAG: hypothetical protein IT446_07140 [Phycisphaerales bacterium]|nr:hypothetical protein [Phycisphaerales bacterium]
MIFKGLIALLLALTWMAIPALAADKPIVIPQRPDPPITVDGRLDDWESVPSKLEINRPEQVVYQPENWKSVDDLSAVVRLCWRPAGLYIAAEVRDDVFSNSGSGENSFRGDVVELYFDATPSSDPSRDEFGAGQTHLLLSPGNLLDDRPPGSFGRINAEVYRIHPDHKSLSDAAIASVKTEKGWTIECFIPWEELGVADPKRGRPFGLEVALSDCDSSASRQEKLMTLSTHPWKHHSRGRLNEAVLADPAGNYVPLEAPKPVTLLNNAEIQPKGEISRTFDFVPSDNGLSPALFIRARLQSNKNDGDTFALNVFVNDQKIDGSRIMNKPIMMRTLDGGTISIFSAGSFGFRIPYASTYDEANLSQAQGNPYARFDTTEPRTDFLIDLSGLLKSGHNVLRLVNADPTVDRVMHVEAELRQVEPPKAAASRELVPATAYFTPEQPVAEVSFRESADTQIAVNVGKSMYLCRSYFSIPGGQWVHDSNRYFKHSRKVHEEKGVIIVEDSFTNLGDQPLGIMQRHEITAEKKPASFYLNGLKRPANLPGYFQSNNPTSFMGDDGGGIGLLPLDDVFRIHGENYVAGDNAIGLCDRMLVIGPGATHVVRWAMAGSADGDYWNLLNTVRRFLGVNFTLTGPGAFMRMYPPYIDWPVEKIREQFLNRSAYYAMNAPSFRLTYKGKTLPYLINHGQAAMDVSEEVAGAKKWRQADPGLKIIQYFACFIDSSDDGDVRFADAAILDAAGKPTNYGSYYYPLFIPTLDNDYGRSQERLLDQLLGKIDLDGIFWDEISYSMVQYHYGKPWDGVSGDIDMKTFEVKQLKSSVAMISKDWRIKQAKKILEHGRTLIANGPIDAQEIRDMHLMAFTETGQASFCARTQLYTPIALGDHLSEVTEADAYRGMLNALDYGCVYYWYSEDVNTTHKTLTEHMYPLTPLRLGPGFLFGKERILTRISGFFGWNDSSDFDVYIYDEKGVLRTDQEAQRVMVDGHAYAAINLWPDWSAAIVRKTQK